MIDSQIIAFAGIAALLTVTPGADTMLVIRSVMARGQRAGLMTTLGICCGLFIHAVLSGLGVSLILVRSAMLFEAVKLIGAGYLIYLGAKSLWGLRRGANVALDEQTAEQRRDVHRRPWQSFVEGMLNNVLNPKVAIFYLAFLPQFINPGDHVLGKSMLLAGIHWGEGIVWLSLVTLLLGRVRAWLTHPRVRKSIEAVTGTVLIAFGVRLALERR
jgi:RhtB (resistance to homoserine/threonine) family protein